MTDKSKKREKGNIVKVGYDTFEYKQPPIEKFPYGSEPFVNLHCHSEYSTLDGMSRIERGVLSLDLDQLYEGQVTLVRAAKSLRQPAIGLTDHGTMGGFFRFHTEAVNNDLNPIIGIEWYVIDKLENLKNKEKNEYSHLTMFATNYDGLINMFKSNKVAWTDGFYYKPKIDYKTLIKYSKNTILLSGCDGDSPFLNIMKSEVSYSRKKTRMLKLAKRLYDVWGDNFYFEIMPHDYEPARILNNELINLSLKLGIPCIATSDIHYSSKKDSKSHEVMLCVQMHQKITDEDHFAFGDGELYVKSRKKVRNDFLNYHSYIPVEIIDNALDNTMDLHRKVHIDIPKKKKEDVLPKSYIPVGYDRKSYVGKLIDQGWKKRNIKKQIVKYSNKYKVSKIEAKKIYKERLKYELKIIRKLGFIDYFLLVQELIGMCRQCNIIVGPGRGSAAASLFCYLLGITSIDPLLYDLMFERFISIYKVTYPDIDMDFDWNKRDIIFDWLKQRYGIENFCHIGTYGVLKGKQVIRDVCRVHGVSYDEANSISKYIIERSGGDERKSMTVLDSFAEFDAMKEFDKKYPGIKEHCVRLEGTIRNAGVHACGVIVSDKNLVEVVPIETRGQGSGKRVVVSAVTGKENEKLGLLKIDVLGLKTLAVLKECLNYIEKIEDEIIDLETIDLENKSVLKDFTDLRYTGVFQFDSIGMRNVIEGFQFKSFDNVVAWNALYRPGTVRSGITSEFKLRASGERKIPKVHSIYDGITKNTMGCIIYQEQISQVFSSMAGFELADSDQIRVSIAKSHGKDVMRGHKDNFMNGCKNIGMKKKKANKLFDQIVMFGSYGFNRCLVGDSIVFKSSSNQYEDRGITISEVYNRWNSNSDVGQKYKYQGLYIMSYFEDGRIRQNKIKNVYYNGIRKVYLVVTKSGYSIKATNNERFVTNDGLIKLKNLNVGDKLIVTDLLYEEKKVYRSGQIRKKVNNKGHLGFKKGKENPCYVDGRTELFTSSKLDVKKRSGNKCESCGRQNKNRKHYLEFAHIKSLDECNYNYGLYHSSKNILHLCNSCHKTYDYSKGERKTRYTKGFPSYYDEVVSIEYIGKEKTYDIEMDGDNHNFVANNIVVHNSHAAAYSTISYWCMWLKHYYPIEFMAALLSQEKDDVKITSYVRECQHLNIEVELPNINKSKDTFTTDGKTIISGISDVKNVGLKASNDIIANQPFNNFYDFLDRVTRRIVNIRVVKSLVLADAFRMWCNNTKMLYENIDSVINAKTESARKKKLKLFKKWNRLEDWNKEEKLKMRRTVFALPSLEHPISFYEKFIKNKLKIKITKICDINFEKEEHLVFIAGQIIDMKFNQIGDFDKAKATDDQILDRKLKLTPQGSRYCNLDLEDETGFKRVHVAPALYNDTNTIFEKGLGSILLVKCRVVKKTPVLFSEEVIDLEKLKDNFEIKSKSEKMLLDNPFNKFPYEKAKRNNIFKIGMYKKRKTFKTAGILSELKFYRTKTGVMAFCTIDDMEDSVDLLLFQQKMRPDISRMLRKAFYNRKILIVKLERLEKREKDERLKFELLDVRLYKGR